MTVSYKFLTFMWMTYIFHNPFSLRKKYLKKFLLATITNTSTSFRGTQSSMLSFTFLK